MADIMSILQASHSTSAVPVPSNTKYVAVDPTLYQGTWTGTYANKKSFTVSVADVSGFRAKVKYQSDGTVKYADVLIKDQSFRIGDTKFLLNKAVAGQAATALIKNVVTDPATGSTFLDTATATQS
jgi:hypothetical protein